MNEFGMILSLLTTALPIIPLLGAGVGAKLAGGRFFSGTATLVVTLLFTALMHTILVVIFGFKSSIVGIFNQIHSPNIILDLLFFCLGLFIASKLFNLSLKIIAKII